MEYLGNFEEEFMNFKKTLIASLFALSIPAISIADIDVTKLSPEEKAELLDKLSEERILLNQQLQVEKLKASIASERESYQQQDENEVEELKSKLEYSEQEIERLNQEMEYLLSNNAKLQDQLNQKKKPSVAKSVIDRMFVTGITGLDSDLKASIYYNSDFIEVKEGQDIIDGLTVSKVTVDEVFVSIPGGEEVRLKHKSRKRAIMDGIQVTTGAQQSAPAPFEFDPENGFVPGAY